MTIFIGSIIAAFFIFLIVEYYNTPYEQRRARHRNNYRDGHPDDRRSRRFDYHPEPYRRRYEDDYYHNNGRGYYRDDRYGYGHRDRGGGVLLFLVIIGIIVAFVAFNMKEDGRSNSFSQPTGLEKKEGSINQKQPLSYYTDFVQNTPKAKTVNTRDNINFTQKPVIKKSYYVQLSTAHVLEKAENRVTEYSLQYPDQMHIAKDINADKHQFKILYGPFISKSSARKAIGNSSAFIRNTSDKNLFFIKK